MKEFIKLIIVKTDWMKTFVGLVLITVFSFTVVYIMKYEIPEGNREIAHFMLGEVSGVALTIASFYYGSSKGSHDKTQIIKEQNEKINP
jgi:hypothetical protein